jgi:hypothetical protein
MGNYWEYDLFIVHYPHTSTSISIESNLYSNVTEVEWKEI